MSAPLDDPAFDRFFQQSYAKTVGVVGVLTGSVVAAEDAVHEALARAWVRRHRIEHLDAWVLTVALNAARSRWRKLRREVPLDGDLTPSGGDLTRTSWSAAASHDAAELRDAIRALPRRQREVVLMHYLLDMPVAEIASALGISEGGVKNALFRARQSLQHALTDRGGVDERRQTQR